MHHVVGTPYVLVCMQCACFSIGASSKAEAAIVFVSDWSLSNNGKEVLQRLSSEEVGIPWSFRLLAGIIPLACSWLLCVDQVVGVVA